jgi:hypothetical protein
MRLTEVQLDWGIMSDQQAYANTLWQQYVEVL